MGLRQLEAGRGFIRLSLLDSGVRKGLDGLKRRLLGFGNHLLTVAKVGGAAMVGFGAALVPAIKAAAEMQEQMSKFDVVFGDSAGSVRKWGDEFAAGVGRSQKQVVSFLASSQDLFVPLGFTPQRATELSKQITKLAVDLGSFNDRADADVMVDLQAALTGSGEVMKKYGVILSEAAVKQELLRQGLDPKTADNQQKAQARLNIIMAGTTAAQGDAIRSAGSFTNQMRSLRATISNVAVGIGQVLLPFLTPLVTMINENIQKVFEWIRTNEDLQAGFETIKNAMADGDFKKAGQVLWAGLRLLWLKGTADLREMWIGFTNVFVKSYHASTINLAKGFVHVVDFLKDAWDGFLMAMSVGWNHAVAFFQKTWQRVKGLFGKDVTEEIARINRELEAANKATLDKRGGAILGREADRKGTLAQLDQMLAGRQRATDQRSAQQIQEAQEALRAAREVWQEATAAARKTEEAATEMEKTAEGGMTPADSPMAAAAAQSGQALFDTRLASLIFGGQGSVQKRQLSELETIAEESARTRQAVEKPCLSVC